MLKRILKFILQHKFLAGLTVLVLIGLGYWGYPALKGNNGEVRYVLAAVAKGTLITSVSGSGQISVSQQVDIKAKSAGDLLYLNAKSGQEVKTGTLLAQLDASDAYKSIRDAEANLEAAKLSLEKLKQPADELSIMQAENTLLQAKESKENAEDDLKKAYDDGFNTVADAFLDLPTIMTGLENIFFNSTIENNQQNIDWYLNQSSNTVAGEREKALSYKDDFYDAYYLSRTNYQKNSDDYKSASRTSGTEIIEALISETYETTKIIADTVKVAHNYIDFIQDSMQRRGVSISTTVSTHQASLDSYTGITNSHLLSLLNIKQTIEESKKAIISADRTIAEKTISLLDLKAGTDPLDIRSQELTIKQRENALLDAREKLADYYIRAPFDGIVAQVDVKLRDSISAGTAIATLITQQRLAEISLNEVDVAKVKVSQKATLTFDAIEGLSITGEVAEIDTLGTVSQGVVTYNIKIVFDTQPVLRSSSATATEDGDERVKPGMSVSATIITDMKQDILLIPNSAIKSSGDVSYVEMLDETVATSTNNSGGIVLSKPPLKQPIQTGLANDSSTEVVSGLKEGDQIITRTISSSSSSSSATTGSQSRGSSFFINTGGPPGR